uniref:Ig-like domain-containing protein n=1 Tax=Chelonoidis abingdonii TaxID=106734 RepID=A0A8C0H586_CHEAB
EYQGWKGPQEFFFAYNFLCHVSLTVNFKVVSPAKPLMVSVGEDALLPCHLSPRMNAEDMEVRWFRSSFPEVIHLYRDGKDQPEQQILEYQGRTELLRDNITEGSVVLRIHSIRPADEGQYSCFFQSSTFYGAALLELKVAGQCFSYSLPGLGSGPHISIADYEAGGIRVVCTSGGWYPEPEMLWRDSSGQLVPSLSQIKSQQENGLFEAQISFVIKERTHPGLNLGHGASAGPHWGQSSSVTPPPISAEGGAAGVPRRRPWLLKSSCAVHSAGGISIESRARGPPGGVRDAGSRPPRPSHGSPLRDSLVT